MLPVDMKKLCWAFSWWLTKLEENLCFFYVYWWAQFWDAPKGYSLDTDTELQMFIWTDFKLAIIHFPSSKQWRDANGEGGKGWENHVAW